MEVYALIGPAGTGKSHRAGMLARRLGIDYVIDDGLLIKKGRILAGVSAKREETQFAAVRRAIFSDPRHREEVARILREEMPDRVLVLGTSRDMVHRITDALDLPRPERYLDIGEVATPEEIRLARHIRRVEGKHVIPAPTMEVKRSFAGYLVLPLRLRKQPLEAFAEKSIVRPAYSSLGRFFISDAAVRELAEAAAREVEGVAGLTGAQVRSGPEGVSLRLDVAVCYGRFIPPLLRAVRERVRERLESLAGLTVIKVEVWARRVVPSSSPRD